MGKKNLNSKDYKLFSRKAERLNRRIYWNILYEEENLNAFQYVSRILRITFSQDRSSKELQKLNQPWRFKNKR